MSNSRPAITRAEGIPGLWALPMGLLMGLWGWLEFSSGGFQRHQWLLPGLSLAVFAAAIFILTAYPRRPRALSLLMVGLFTAYTFWVALSASWAASLNSAWDETARTLLYLLALSVASVYLPDRTARRILRHLLLAGALALVLASVTVLRLANTDTIALLFTENRFSFPATYPNNAAAMFMVFFWPVLWMAADPNSRVLVRGLALGTASALLCLTVATQSRGAAYAFAITVILTFLLSPVRLRTLFFLLVPSALLIWAFPGLNAYWSEGPTALSGTSGARIVLEAGLIAGGTGALLALLERWVSVTQPMRRVFGAAALVVTFLAAGWGLYALDSHVGDTSAWLSDTWQRFTADQATTIPGLEGSSNGGSPSSRFATVSTSGRWDIWRVAWDDFRAAPIQGVGAGNFVFTYDRGRHRESAKPRQPHSIELRVLSETGLVGGLLFFGALLVGLGDSLAAHGGCDRPSALQAPAASAGRLRARPGRPPQPQRRSNAPLGRGSQTVRMECRPGHGRHLLARARQRGVAMAHARSDPPGPPHDGSGGG
ncbi:MAG: O-antigen ligase family protein [Thermoleophilia bacterium]|nr:O-antigen ligase family protein [Thermoleophilia bacterium]